MQHILFVCTGNTCRSPIAEGLMRKLAKESGLSIEVRSAGVHAHDGGNISGQSACVLRERGADSEMVSCSITSELVNWADLILTMTIGHKEIVTGRYNQATDKTYALKEFAKNGKNPLTGFDALFENYDISDPYGGSIERYRLTAIEIEEGLQALITQISES